MCISFPLKNHCKCVTHSLLEAKFIFFFFYFRLLYEKINTNGFWSWINFMAIFFLLEFIWIPDRFYSVADKMIKRKLEFKIWKWVWITLHVESSRDENMVFQDQLIKHPSRVSVFKKICTKTSLSHNSYLSFNNYNIRWAFVC